MTMTWLAQACFSSAWAHLPTTEFRARAAMPGALAILPVYGCAHHGLGLPLDAEEAVGDALLSAAGAANLASGNAAPVVLPPLRFGPAPQTASAWFGISLELTLEIVREIALGVKFSGFGKLLIYSTSPWHREALDAAARDIRVETGLTVYRVHLASLGFDFHPAAPADVRLATQALAASLLNAEPVSSPPQDSADENFRPGRWVQAPPLPAGMIGVELNKSAAAIRTAATMRLSRIITEAAWHNRVRPVVTEPEDATSPAPHPGPIAPRWRPFGARQLAALTREQLRAAALAPRALAVLPTGAIEQHGPHLPVGVDAILGQGLLARALTRLPASTPVFVAPPITVGKSNEHADWPGTLTLSARSFIALVRAQVGELHRLGFRRIAIFNTHGGNSAVLVPLIRELQNLPGLRIGMLQSTYKADQSAQEAAYGFHAGEWETALMLALAPEVVRMQHALCHYPARLDDPAELRPEGAALNLAWTTRDIAPEGVMGDATLANAAQGTAWVEATARSLAERLTALSSG
ncbi:MAG: creatininase family protein [Verrucomicrobia bacterium]|nr:creatininase family protein [Verrucomicrobiota bacterium]